MSKKLCIEWPDDPDDDKCAHVAEWPEEPDGD